MNVAGSSLLYSRLAFPEACARLSALGFDRVDVGAVEGWAHLDPSEVVDTVDETVASVRTACSDAGIEPIAFNAGLGSVDLAEECRRIRALATAADDLGIEVLTLPAGHVDSDLAADIERFRELAAATAAFDVTLTVETHWDTHTEDPQVAVRYASEVEGLGLTLDPGHYAVGPYWESDDGAPAYDLLLADVEHVHVRQAGDRWSAIQRPFDAADGRIDFEALFDRLRRIGFDGSVTVEYIDSLEDTTPEEAESWAADARKTTERLL